MSASFASFAAAVPTIVARGLIAVYAALALPSLAHSQTAGHKPLATPAQSISVPSDAAFDAVFDAWRAASDPETVIVVARRDGKIVFSRGYNADPNGPTLIGSMSKAITGACAATLIRDGKLSFKTPMREALAGFFREHGRPLDPRFETVTVEQLLTHRSGLHNNRDDPFFEIRRQRIAEHLASVASPAPMLKTFLSENMLVKDPGAAFAYSNSGYLALTAVIEERAGRPFEDYCREKVFVPLGLKSAGLNPEWRMLGGYGGWYINGEDYLSFLDIFDPAYPFLGAAVKAWINAVRDRAGLSGTTYWYSLGVRTSARDGRWKVWHTGTLGSRGIDAEKRPISAYINSLASHDPSGTAIFVAAAPVRGDKNMRRKVAELHKEMSRIAGGR